VVFIIKALAINSEFSLYIKLLSIKVRERYAGKDRVGKAAGAGVQLPEQESGAYRVKREIAQRARP
jgi:hypothetical protein